MCSRSNKKQPFTLKMAMPEGDLCKQQQHSHALPIFFNPSSDFGSFTGGGGCSGGLFLEPTIPDSFVRFIPPRIPLTATASSEPKTHRRRRRVPVGLFLSVSLPNAKLDTEPKPYVLQNGDHVPDKEATLDGVVSHKKVRVKERNAVNNTTKHLWAGAIAAMVSRYVLLLSQFCIIRRIIRIVFLI